MEQPISIELKLISCKNLKAFNFFQKLTLYAVVSIDSNNPTTQLSDQQKQQQRTQTHRDPDDGDGSNPEWNHEARFDLGLVPRSRNTLFFCFEFRHDGVILGDKLVGECRVPLADLIRDADCVGGAARFVSYEVRNGDGKPNGIFNFSYRLKGIGSGSGTHSSQILEGRISGYPVVDPNQSQVQYPTSEIEKPCCYPTVALPVGSVQEGLLYSPPPPPPPIPALSLSSGEFCCYCPPPLLRRRPPPYPYPPPPPPPPPPLVQGTHYYRPFGPRAHPRPSGPNFQHRW